MLGLIKRILQVVLMVLLSARIAFAAVPGAPSGLTVAVIPGAADLRWNASTGTVTGYQVWRAVGANWVWIATVPPTTLYFRDTSVAAYTTYTYGMRAHNNEGVSNPSNFVTVATQSIVPTPATNVTAQSVTSNSVSIRWGASSGVITAYQVWRNNAATGWQRIADTAPTTLAYTDNTVAASTFYQYGIRAYNANGVSDASNTLNVTTPATQSTVPTPPTNVTAQSVTSNSVSIRWGASSGAVTAYQVWRNSAAGWQRIADTAPTTLAYTDNTVTPSTSYQYGIRAYNTIGVSDASNILNVTTPSAMASAYACPDCVQVKIGPVEYAVGPTWEIDNPFNAINVSGVVRGYFGNQTTLLYEGSAVNSLTRVGSVMWPGTGFDSCGAWLNSAYVDGSIIRGWYHAETQCNYSNNGQTHKSIAYAESRDGGRSWVKYNQILTGVTQPTPGQTSGLGDHSVVRVGNYFYAYFYNADAANWGIAVARAPVSSGGVPGSWAMYRNGAFNEPAYGGRPSILSTITGSAVARLTDTELTAVSNPWMSLAYLSANQAHEIWMSFSADGLNWKRLAQPLVTVPSNEQIAYASVVHPTGGSILGGNFYLYYMSIPPGAGMDARYLVRRRIEFKVYPTSITPHVVPF